MAFCETFACTLVKYRNIDAFYIKLVFGAMNLACISLFLYRLNRIAGVKNNVVSIQMGNHGSTSACFRRTEQ